MSNLGRSFVSRNLVTIVMIPSIFFIHYGWNVMQNNRKLVSEEEQIELPPVMLAKHVWRNITGEKNLEKPCDAK